VALEIGLFALKLNSLPFRRRSWHEQDLRTEWFLSAKRFQSGVQRLER
jgi:hypothetical protein